MLVLTLKFSVTEIARAIPQVTEVRFWPDRDEVATDAHVGFRGHSGHRQRDVGFPAPHVRSRGRSGRSIRWRLFPILTQVKL